MLNEWSDRNRSRGRRPVLDFTLGIALVAVILLLIVPVFEALAQTGVSPRDRIRSDRWAYDEGADPITDQKGSIAAIKSVDGKSLFAFQCSVSTKENPLLFQLRLPARAMLGKRPSVTIRTDNDQPFSMDWHSVGDAILIWRPDQIERISRALRSADRATVRVLDIHGQSVDTIFNLSKPAPLFDKVMQTCGTDIATTKKMGN